jgi:hypothetical protein
MKTFSNQSEKLWDKGARPLIYPLRAKRHGFDE